MIITSVVLLATAFALLVVGAVQGNPAMLEVSLGAAGGGALALYAGNASAKRAAMARGVPVEAVLVGRVRRTPEAAPAANGPPAPPPIDGYDDMPVSEVTRLVASGAMARTHLSDMLVYEASHRRRREVLTAIMDVVGPDAELPGGPDAEPPVAADDDPPVAPDAEQRATAGAGAGTGSVRRRIRDSAFARPKPGAPDPDE
jgi:hypothetical protein